tara:strand:+ start:125 stop:382 length:258 start_codon:yes stop_codon:yes gene_type:complete
MQRLSPIVVEGVNIVIRQATKYNNGVTHTLNVQQYVFMSFTAARYVKGTQTAEVNIINMVGIQNISIGRIERHTITKHPQPADTN